MTSHREAPKISKDPVADNTDLYAFVSPDKPDTVTILANYVPLEEPAGGPNFNTFGDDVLYEIVIDNNGDGMEDITYQFRFKTKIGNLDTFLYNTGPISSLSDSSWNVKQLYSVTRVRGPRRSGSSTVHSTGQHRTKVNPELYRPGKCGGQYSKRRVERVRRPTRRSVLRRPRVHIRLRDTQTVPEPAPYSYTRRSRRGHDKRVQRPFNSDTGPEEFTDP